MTFDELFHLYYEKHCKLRTKCPENAFYFYRVHKEQWKGRRLAGIEQAEVQDWCDELAIKSKSAATRAVNMMSACINWGIKRGYYKGLNPCVGVEKYDIRARERFLLPDEMERFMSALNQSPARDFFLVCLLTGARRGNVCAMRWDEVDLKLAIWTFDNKNGERHTVALSDPVVAILSARKRSGEWIFPGRSGGHYKEPKRAWKAILKRAEITNLRIHDLRRTLGSYLAIQGFNEVLIGKQLGHKDPRSTRIYARLNLAPLRVALDAVNTYWGLSM